MIRRIPAVSTGLASLGTVTATALAAVFPIVLVLCTSGCRGVSGVSTESTAGVGSGNTLGESAIERASLVEENGIREGLQTGRSAFQLSQPASESDWLNGTHVVAIVNGEPLFASEILHRQSRSLSAAREQLPGPRYRELQDDLIRKQLRGYVERRLMSQAMLSGLEPDRRDSLDEQLDVIFTKQELPQLLSGRGLQSKVQLQRKLTDEGTSLEILKEDFNQQQLAMEYLRQTANLRTTFSPSEMVTWYRGHLDDFQTTPRVRWRQILISESKHGDRDGALRVIETIRRRLSAGESFEALARELSDGPAASDGGQWDWTDRESFQDKRISESLFRLAVGVPSRILEGSEFFQLVVATEREDGGAAKFESVQDEVEKRMADESRIKEMERVVKALQLTAQVTTAFDQPGRPFIQSTVVPPTDGSTRTIQQTNSTTTKGRTGQ
jgi:parvulin-like peptidyl-prolyl isomerase